MTVFLSYHKRDVAKWKRQLRALIGADLSLSKVDTALRAIPIWVKPALRPAAKRLLPTLPEAATKPRKHRPATDIKRIEKATGKKVTAVTLSDDGCVSSLTFGEAPASETNPFEAEAARLRALKRGSA